MSHLSLSEAAVSADPGKATAVAADPSRKEEAESAAAPSPHLLWGSAVSADPGKVAVSADPSRKEEEEEEKAAAPAVLASIPPHFSLLPTTTK